MRGTRRLTAVALATALLWSASGCSDDEPDAADDAGTSTEETTGSPEPGGVFRRATSEPTSIDPSRIVDTAGYTVTRLLYSGLVAFDEDARVVPAVATSWTTSDDGLTWTFELGESTFSNGRAVVAEDFAFAYRREADPDLAGERDTSPILGWAEALDSEPDGVIGNVELPGVRALDDDTLEIELTEPDAFFLDTLADMSWPVPAEEVETAEAAAAFVDRPIGNGPYLMSEPWAHNERIHLERNPDYAGEPPLADRIEFEIFSDVGTAFRELQGGGVDLSSVPPGQYQTAEAEFGDRFLTVDSAFLIYVGFPLGGGLPTDDLGVRQALSLAIDRAAMAERVLEGAAAPAHGFAPSGFPGTPDEPCEYTEYDPERARDLYDRSGGVPGDALTGYYPSGVGFDEAVTVIANDVRNNLGIELTFKTMETVPFFEMVTEGADGPYGFGLATGIPSAYGFLQPTMESDGQFNDGFHDEQFDELMDSVRAADPDDRDALLEEASELACSELPIVPLVFDSASVAHSERISNVIIDPLGIERLELVEVTG